MFHQSNIQKRIIRPRIMTWLFFNCCLATVFGLIRQIQTFEMASVSDQIFRNVWNLKERRRDRMNLVKNNNNNKKPWELKYSNFSTNRHYISFTYAPYLANKTFPRLVYPRIMPKAERLSEKWTVGREAKLWIFEDNLSAERIILRYTNKPERGIIYFMTLGIIYQGERT